LQVSIQEGHRDHAGVMIQLFRPPAFVFFMSALAATNGESIDTGFAFSCFGFFFSRLLLF
jgi:hypothetical protein